MPSILFVCTANQTRSPIAAALFTCLLRESGQLAGWRIESAGTWVTDGLPASRTAQRVMQSMQLDLSKHRTRCVTAALLAPFDLILVMEAGHKEALQVEFPAIARRVYLLSEMVGATASPACAVSPADIADPTGGSDDDVRETARLIARLLTQGITRIRQLTAPND